jgi:hypothetical protein
MWDCGEVAEWSKAIDCKSIHRVYIGSNPIFSREKKMRNDMARWSKGEAH